MVKQSKKMRGGSVELQKTEINNSGYTTTTECSTQQVNNQQIAAEKQIEMRNQAGGSQRVAIDVVAGSSTEDAALQSSVQKTAYNAQAQAEFDNCVGKEAGQCGGRGKYKRRKSKRRKRRRKSKRRKRRKSKRRKRKTKRRKTKRKTKRK